MLAVCHGPVKNWKDHLPSSLKEFQKVNFQLVLRHMQTHKSYQMTYESHLTDWLLQSIKLLLVPPCRILVKNRMTSMQNA